MPMLRNTKTPAGNIIYYMKILRKLEQMKSEVGRDK